jgi:GTP-binding protein Era
MPKPKASPKKSTRAGFAAILGAPNAGKSTLVNRLVGEKVSIVSPKVQTTRMRVLGVLTEAGTQIGLIDTPGIFAPKRRLDRAMVQAAWQSLESADAVVWLIDAAARDAESLDAIADALKQRKQRVIIALNKVDKVPKAKLLPLAAKLSEYGVADDMFMISALTGDGIDDLKKHLLAKMPKSPFLYDPDQLSALPQQLLAAEITREQLYRQLQQELPYAATVVPESWEPGRDAVTIRQNIVVARPGHRPIVLGKGGARIKSLGQAARTELAQLLGTKVHLFLDVKVDEKWQDRPHFYQLFGLEFAAR